MKSNNDKWAWVKLDNNDKRAVPVEDIFKFDPENYNSQKEYYIMIDGETYKGVVLLVKDTEGLLEAKESKRVSVPTKICIKHISDLRESEPEFLTKNSKSNGPSTSGKDKSKSTSTSQAKNNKGLSTLGIRDKLKNTSTSRIKHNKGPSTSGSKKKSEAKNQNETTSVNDNVEHKKALLKAVSLKRQNTSEPLSNVATKKATIVLRRDIIDQLKNGAVTKGCQGENVAVSKKGHDDCVLLIEPNHVENRLRTLEGTISSLQQQLEAEREKNNALQASINRMISQNAF